MNQDKRVWSGRARKSIRQFCLSVHLYLALTVGFFFVMLGLTGSVNVFYYELGELGLPAPSAQPSQPPRDLDAIMHILQAAHPQRTGGWSIVLPGYLSDYLWVEYPKPVETAAELFAPLEILVDPYTGNIVEEHFWGRTWMSLVYELHADLMTGKLGRTIGEIGFKTVCFIGILWLISSLSGLYLWWPGKAAWRKALTVRRSAEMGRFTFDLHRAIGFYTSALLIVISFTGVAFAYNGTIRSMVSLFSTVHADHLKEPQVKSIPRDHTPRISIARAVEVADSVFPDAELRGINTPDGPEGVYMVAKRQAGEANRKRPRSKVWIDQYSGQILAVQDPNLFTSGETLMNVLWPLHDGQAFGLAGRIMWGAVGIVAPPVLYVTGIVRWLQKRRANARRRAKPV